MGKIGSRTIWIGLLLIAGLLRYTVADTRYECIVNLRGRGENEGFGGFGGFGEEADEFENEMGEMGEADEGGMGGFGGGWMATGSLTCPQGNRGNILVKRVAYGTSMFGSTCRNDGFCKEEYDTADNVANRCDGKSSCFIDMLQPVFLKCGRMSTYMLVEYECVDSWTTFDVCGTISTVARGASVFMTSPGYLTSTTRKSTNGRQMCECILQSQNGADIYMDYLQTQLTSDGDKCPYEYVMVESKKNITSSTIDKELEVCGRRHVGARWLKGSIRLTYASGGQMQRRGMIAKFTADNIGTAPRIELECGPVDASRLTLKERPPPPPKQNQFPNPMFPPFGPRFPGMNYPMPPMGPMGPFGFGGNGTGPMPTMPMPAMPMPPFPTFGLVPDLSSMKINIPGENPNEAAAAPAKPAGPANAPKPPQRLVPKGPGNKQKPPGGGRRPNQNQKKKNINRRKNRAGKVVDDGDVTVAKEDVKVNKTSGKGGLMGLVFGGIGAVLILGSVGILAINNYRKRKRIKQEEAEYYYGRSDSSTYGQGWKKAEDDYESVYATVAEVETYRNGACVNPAVGKDMEEGSFVNPVKDANADRSKEAKKKAVVKSSKSARDEPDVRPSCSKDMTPPPEKKIAVIEVHRVPDEYIAVTYGNDLHSAGCLAANSYTSVKKDGDGKNRCSECNIARPPRRRDSDYDNNIGVKKSQK